MSAKTPLLVAGFGKTRLGIGKPPLGQPEQSRVLRQTENTDPVLLAPDEQADKSRWWRAARYERRATLGTAAGSAAPGLPSCACRHRSWTAADRRPAAVRRKIIGRQKAVVVVIPLEKGPSLAAMHRHSVTSKSRTISSGEG
jgi:hypothetical protein